MLYILGRLARSLLTLLAIISIVFLLLRLMPVEGYFPNFEKMSEQEIADGLHNLGLDRPLVVQLFHFLKNFILKGDLGTSLIYRRSVPVTEILAPKIPISLKLGSMSIIIALLFGIPIGALMTRNKGGFLDGIGTGYIVFIQAVPAAVYYLFIQLYGTKLLSVPLLFSADSPATWVLPVISMSLGNTAYYAMWLRRYMVDEGSKEYVRLARAKGASENRIVFRHVLRNAFVPMVQYLPTSFLNTVIGSIYIESLYGIPGMGGLLVDVIKKQDNTMVQAIVLLFASVGVLGLMLGDIAMVLLDPRIKLIRKEARR